MIQNNRGKQGGREIDANIQRSKVYKEKETDGQRDRRRESEREKDNERWREKKRQKRERDIQTVIYA